MGGTMENTDYFKLYLSAKTFKERKVRFPAAAGHTAAAPQAACWGRAAAALPWAPPRLTAAPRLS